MEAAEQFQGDRSADPEPYPVADEGPVDGGSLEVEVPEGEVITPLDHDDEEDTPAQLTHHYRPDSLLDEVEPEVDSSLEPMIDAVKQLLKGSRKYPLLNAGQEVDLAKRIERGDLMAKERLINSNLRLVASNARRYQGLGTTLDDLVEDGILGLIRASEKFDWRKGFRFSTYATLWIRQAIQRGLENNGRTIRLPVHVMQRVRSIQRAEWQLTQRLGVEPTAEQLAEATGKDIEQIHEARELSMGMASLNKTADDNESELGDIVADETDTVQEAQDRNLKLRVLQHIHRAVAEGGINSQQAALVVRRYGLGGSLEPETQRSIAHDLGIPIWQVASIEEQTLRKLKPWFDEERLA